MISLKINNEYAQLKTVVLGIAKDFGGTPKLQDCYDPKSREHVKNGNFPNEESLVNELNQFLKVFKKYNVNVLRPDNIKNLNQIFSRDIAFVIDDKIIIPNIINERRKEITGINSFIEEILEKYKGEELVIYFYHPFEETRINEIIQKFICKFNNLTIVLIGEINLNVENRKKCLNIYSNKNLIKIFSINKN